MANPERVTFDLVAAVVNGKRKSRHAQIGIRDGTGIKEGQDREDLVAQSLGSTHAFSADSNDGKKGGYSLATLYHGLRRMSRAIVQLPNLTAAGSAQDEGVSVTLAKVTLNLQSGEMCVRPSDGPRGSPIVAVHAKGSGVGNAFS